MNWKLKLEKARELVGKSNAGLYDRVKLLVEVYEDPDFLDFHDNVYDKAEAELDKALGDYGICFLDAMDIMKHFPKKAEWKGGNLREMLAEAVQARINSRREKAPKSKRKGPVAHKEYEKVLKAKEAADQRIKSLEEDNLRLREENRKLTAEVARNEGRIAELERVLEMKSV